MPPPFSRPVQELTIPEYIQRLDTLAESKDSVSYVNLALSGITESDHQVKVASLRHRLDTEAEADHPILFTRDIDSANIISPEIVVNGEIYFNFIPKHYESLSKNIRLSYDIVEGETVRSVPVHKIPNYGIAKWKLRDSIRICFPRLSSEARQSHHLFQVECQLFYDLVVRPAMAAEMDIRGLDLPPNYTSEMFRSRSASGRLILSGRPVPSWIIHNLVARMRDLVEESGLEWAEGFFFLHEIRGLKSASYHAHDELAAEEALEEFWGDHCVDPEALENPQCHCWIDIGGEVSSNHPDGPKCLAWLAEAHPNLLIEVAKLSRRRANALTVVGNGKYYRDPTSHFIDLCGFRAMPGVRSQGPYKMVYCQAYQTCKSVTAIHDGNDFAKRITVNDMLTSKKATYIDNLIDLYEASQHRVVSCARIEVRVPLRYANTVMLGLNPSVFRDSLASIDVADWWAIRIHKAVALQHVIRWIQEGDTKHQMDIRALLLLGASAWLLNALHATPDDGPSSRKLMDAVLPRRPRRTVDPDHFAYRMRKSSEVQNRDEDNYATPSDDEADDLENIINRTGVLRFNSPEPTVWPYPVPAARDRADTIPCNEHGMIFLRDIRIGPEYPNPRFATSPHSTLDEAAFKFTFGCNPADVEKYFRKKHATESANTSRTKNRVPQRLTITSSDAEKMRLLIHVRGADELAGTTVADRDTSDEEMASPDEEGDVRLPRALPTLTKGQEINLIYTHMLRDILNTSPNQRKLSEGSYCRLTREERSAADESLYKVDDLGKLFHCGRFKRVGTTSKVWELAFDRLVPEKGAMLPTGAQNYLTSVYYLRWQAYMENHEDWREAREGIRKRFNKLRWMPLVKSDRIWCTRRDPKLTPSPGLSDADPAPQFILRGDLITFSTPVYAADSDQE
ncbi:hypothetical protein FA15DRAFT_711465 [Coprinopsis marcescibilis]|uniref:Uncharacterized protein n=1 Tax=Coprinopsis marcescibilis TaxID=230819 RepID=A0A5C3K9J7_COPMA|nr:hypothetical protein FA15DRAFT_711465 [Coprinopsis marcescibilis]